MLPRVASSFLVISAALLAQASAPSSRAADKGLATITAQRAKEALSFLASDEMLGRDTPSVGLTRASEYLRDRYQKAGLEPGATDKTFFHGYEMSGYRLDQTGLTVTAELEDGTKRELESEKEVRVLKLGGGFTSEMGRVDIVTDGQLKPRAQRPVLILVEPDNPLWGGSVGVRESLKRGGRGEAPVLLVRKDCLGDAKIARAAISVPEPESAKIQLRNVVALLPGSSRREETVIVSAHYDHIGLTAPIAGDSINNGADDDGSGTVAVLLLAEALAARGVKLPRTVAFVNFSAEEQGLSGSRAFAANPPFPLEKVVANLNIEMVGRPAPGKQHQAWLTGRKYSDLESIIAPVMAEAGVECVSFELEQMLFVQSDNLSLARKGVVAHSISAGSLHGDYHKPSDEVAKIEFEHMTTVIRALYAACIEVASRDQAPAWNETGRKALSRPSRR